MTDPSRVPREGDPIHISEAVYEAFVFASGDKLDPDEPETCVGLRAAIAQWLREQRVPNATTEAAIEAAEQRTDVATFGSVQEMFEDLAATRDTERLDRLERLLAQEDLELATDQLPTEVRLTASPYGDSRIVAHAPTLRGCLDQLTQEDAK